MAALFNCWLISQCTSLVTNDINSDTKGFCASAYMQCNGERDAQYGCDMADLLRKCNTIVSVKLIERVYEIKK